MEQSEGCRVHGAGCRVHRATDAGPVTQGEGCRFILHLVFTPYGLRVRGEGGRARGAG